MDIWGVRAGKRPVDVSTASGEKWKFRLSNVTRNQGGLSLRGFLMGHRPECVYTRACWPTYGRDKCREFGYRYRNEDLKARL